MAKDLQDYILGLKKEYNLRLRFLVDLEDQDLDKLERHLKKYDLLEIGAPKKTIFQKYALGWHGPVNSEVLIVDITLGAPVSPHTLEYDVARLFKISRDYVRVTREGYEQEDLEAPANSEEEYEPKVSTDPEYPEDKDRPDNSEFYGDKYNAKMIKTLSDARKEAKKTITGQTNN